MSETFECDVCHGVFEKARTDEEAVADMHATWRQPMETDEDGLGVICDDCFRRLIARVRREAPELLA